MPSSKYLSRIFNINTVIFITLLSLNSVYGQAIYKFRYTGNDQTFTVPANVSLIKIEAWGAGGGKGSYSSSYSGGAGGYSVGTMEVTPGDRYTIVVGRGGIGYGSTSYRTYQNGGPATYGGGGYGTRGDASGASGGGLSGIFSGTSRVFNGANPTSNAQSRAILIAGGGGGSTSYAGGGGGGGGSTGSRTSGGYGGTQISGGRGTNGADGRALRGGDGDRNGNRTSGSSDGGGGGGGYYGGEGGFSDASPGGGGSGYIHPSLLSNAQTIQGSNGNGNSITNPPNNNISTYESRVGIGGYASGSASGGNGLVVITELSSGGKVSSVQSLFCSESLNPSAFSSISAAAGGSGAFSYQWQKSLDGSSFTDISGATSETYNSGTITQTTYFRRKASNTITLYSNVLTLEKFEITSQPSSADQNLIPNATPNNLSVSVSNTSGASYQWYKNGSDSNAGGTSISGATNATYSPPTASVGIWYYYVVVSKGGCSISSEVSGVVNVGNPISSIPLASDTWHPVFKDQLFDASNDNQGGVSNGDLVGNATNAVLESQQETYNFSSGVAADQTYYFRARLGDTHSSGILSASVFMGVDINADFKADIFVEANAQASTPVLKFRKAATTNTKSPNSTAWQSSGSNTNIERTLTSRDALVSVYNAASDIDANGETDSFMEFSFTQESLKTFTSDALGASVDGGTINVLYLFSGASNTIYDIAGINDSTADLTKTWRSLGTISAGSLNEVSRGTQITPVINSGQFASTTPILSGFWGGSLGGSQVLSLTINGNTYTTASGLSIIGNSWSMTLPGSDALSPASSYTAAVASTKGGETKTATATIYIKDNDASLSGLSTVGLTLSPSFSGSTYNYSATASTTFSTDQFRATASSSSATLKVNGITTNSGVTRSVAISYGVNEIPIVLVAENEIDSKTYTITVTRSAFPTVEVTDAITDEYGDTASVRLVLPEAPTSDVRIDLFTDTAQATLDASIITFTTSNWNTPQTITLTGVDDSVRELPASYVLSATTVTTDPAYNGVWTGETIANLTHLDNEPPGIRVALTGQDLNEKSGTQTATFSLLSLLTPANAVVSMTISLSDASEASFESSSVVTSKTISFTNTVSTTKVSIYAVEDTVRDGTQSFTLVTGDPVSTGSDADTGYDGLSAADVADVSLNNIDNEYISVMYTDYGGFWMSGEGNINGTKPENDYNLLGFSYGGTVYSTGVSDAILSANGVSHTADTYRAVPINAIDTGSRDNYYIGFGQLKDGLNNGLDTSTATPFEANPSASDLAQYLTDGPKGLNMGSGFANILSGTALELGVNAITNSKIGDGIPDILVTQIAAPSSAYDAFWFEDSSGNVVGNKISITMNDLSALGTWTADFYRPDGINGLSNTDRDLRIKAFELSEFGINSGNSSSVAAFIYELSGTSDPAFIAYNTPSISFPTSLHKTSSPTTYKSNLSLTAPYEIQVKDGSGNNINQSGILVKVGVVSGTGTLSGTLEVTTDANGKATFSDLSLQGLTDQVLGFTAPGLDTLTTTLTFQKTAVTLSDFPDIVKVYTDPDFLLTPPTTTSSGTFSFSSSTGTVATIDASTGSITIVGTGTTTILAAQTGTANYNSGSISATLTVEGANPTISGWADLTKTFNDPVFTPTLPSSDSGGSFTYSSTNTAVANINSSTGAVTITGAGAAILRASQAATTNFKAGNATLILTVNKDLPIISGFNDLNKTFNDPVFALSASSSSTGSFNYSSLNPAIATVDSSTGSVTIVSAGSALLVATQATDTNYLTVSSTLALTVAKDRPDYTGISDLNVKYGDSNFTLTPPSSTSTATFTYASSDSSVATVDANSGSLSIQKAGSTIISATQAANENYSSGTTSFTLMVDKKNPEITGFVNLTKTFGGANFELVNPSSESPGAFSFTSSDTTVASISGNLVSIVGAGTVTLTALQAETTNYNAATVTATLTVDKAAQSISIAPLPTTQPLKDFTSIPLTATATSGTGVVVSIDTGSAATLSGTVGDYELVSILTAGVVSVTFTAAATANYQTAYTTLSLDVVKTAQNITYATALPTSIAYESGLSIPLTASATSGLGVSYRVVSGPASLSGTSLTISDTGAVVVDATQAGNTFYNPAPRQRSVLNVTQGTTTISSFSIPTKTNLDPDFNFTPPTSNRAGTLYYSSSNPSVATVSGTTISILSVGNTTITASQLPTSQYRSGSNNVSFEVQLGDSDGDGVRDPLDNCPTTANPDQADTDGDGVGDVCDNAPNIPNPDQKDTDGDGIGDVADTDDDNDGCLDTSDAFPLDSSECSDNDGDGIGDNADPDDDNDTILDSIDNCPTTPNTDQKDTDADGTGDVCDNDDDNDGMTDDQEATCGTDPLDPADTPIDTDADGIPDCIDTDKDNDGYADENDAFPLNKDEHLDTDADGIGNNADTDDDNDGQSDEEEVFCGTDPLDATSFSGDVDQDGVSDCRDQDNDNDGVNDAQDAFPLDPSEWTDTDADGIGNNADEDDDNDGFTDLDELACNSNPLEVNSVPGDLDGDGIPDCLDNDIDGDGCINTEDVFPIDPSECSDADGDGLGDNIDIDSDNDGVPNSQDAFPLDPSETKDADGDGIGDNADQDDNNDGFNDAELQVSGVLTPNSSGLESTWKIINLEKYPNARVTVYNKNGQEVFSAQGYRNDWRGTYKNSENPLPAASYYYVVELNTGEEPITGWMYITY